MSEHFLEPSPEVLEARSKWRYRGAFRPAFAIEPGPGQESVWDYPRPPRIDVEHRRIQVLCNQGVIAETTDALRVCETASPPTFYVPPDHVDTSFLHSTSILTRCEWKGLAEVFDAPGIEQAAWSYTSTFPEAAALADYFAFYPGKVACFVDGERAQPQPGGYYGGWVTAEIVGPFKGENEESAAW